MADQTCQDSPRGQARHVVAEMINYFPEPDSWTLSLFQHGLSVDSPVRLTEAIENNSENQSCPC